MTKFILIFALVLAGCGERIVYVYPDGGNPEADADAQDSAQSPDAGEDGGSPALDGGDALDAPMGACNPDRTPGTISQNDCAVFPTRPVCDAITNACVPVPAAYCGACGSDAQCQAFDLNARCIFLDGDVPSNDDQACLAPCAAGADPCGYLGEGGYLWSYRFQCVSFSRGNFCVPMTAMLPMCRTASSTRVGP